MDAIGDLDKSSYGGVVEDQSLTGEGLREGRRKLETKYRQSFRVLLESLPEKWGNWGGVGKQRVRSRKEITFFKVEEMLGHLGGPVG